MSPRFDDSLAELAAFRGPILAWIALALFGAIGVARLLDRQMRRRWAKVPIVGKIADRPYRSGAIVAGYVTEVPFAVRTAAISCFAFGHVFAPALVAALLSFRFDGIATPLIPGVGVAIATWLCGALLLRRSPMAPEIVRCAAVASLVLNVSLFTLSVVHLALVEGQASTGHVCSSSLAFIAFVFAGAAIPQAAFMLYALRAHRGAFAAGALELEPGPAE